MTCTDVSTVSTRLVFEDDIPSPTREASPPPPESAKRRKKDSEVTTSPKSTQKKQQQKGASSTLQPSSALKKKAVPTREVEQEQEDSSDFHHQFHQDDDIPAPQIEVTPPSSTEKRKKQKKKQLRDEDQDEGEEERVTTEKSSKGNSKSSKQFLQPSKPASKNATPKKMVKSVPKLLVSPAPSSDSPLHDTSINYGGTDTSVMSLHADSEVSFRMSENESEDEPDTPISKEKLDRAKLEAAELLSEGIETRRGKRRRMQPLQYWKNERVVYGRRTSGFGVVDLVPPRPSPVSKRLQLKALKKAQGGSNTITAAAGLDDPFPDLQFASFDKKAPPLQRVLGKHKSEIEIEQNLIPSNASSSKSKVQVFQAFAEQRTKQGWVMDSSWATGRLIIPKNTECVARDLVPCGDKEYAIIFYIISGKLLFSFDNEDEHPELETGGQFWIPSNIQCSVKNKSSKDCQLLYFLVS